MSDMRIAGKLTAEDLNDVRKIARSKMYWLKLLLANWYGIGLFIALLWATIAGLLGQTKPNWAGVVLIWAMIAAIFGWAVFNTKRTRARELTQLNATLPDYISFTTEGVKTGGPNAATSFLPWQNFKGWREGRQVILADQAAGNGFVILPVSEMSEIERESIRQFLRSHIRPANQ